MELGWSLPTAGDVASPATIARIAKEAEQLGYGAVWTFERLLRPVDGAPHLPAAYRLVYDPLETLSYLAALTDRIRLGTSVIDALFHPPVVLARRFATLDQLSGGRVIAGLGQGWMAEEFETANVPLRRKGAGMDEVVAALRACWGPDPVAYRGRFYRIAASEVGPKPVQAHVPIVLGVNSTAGAQRAARIADGINPIAFTADALRGLIADFRDAARAAGRDPAGLTVAVRANVPVTVEPIGDDRPFLGGSPAQIAADFAELDGLGVDHVLFSNRDTPDVDTELRLLDQLMSAVSARA